MRSIRVMMLAVFTLALCQAGFAQRGGLAIEGSTATEGAFPGQMMELFVAGFGAQLGPAIPIERFQVLVTQGGATHKAQVRAAALGLMNPRAFNPTAAPAEKVPDISEQMAGAKPYQLVTFTVPLDLQEGEASVVVKYRDRQSNDFKIKIVKHFPKPQLAIMLQIPMTSAKIGPPIPDDVKMGTRRVLRIERGVEAELNVRPLLDPEVPHSGLVVTFTQGSFTKAVDARIVRREGTEASGATVIFAPIRYQVLVRVPEELELGSARIEVRLKLREQLSEPASEEVLITDSSGIAGSADRTKPVITNIGERRIGIGQAVKVSIDPKWLEPDPSKTLIVLEQGSTRIELKPEMNSAARRARLSVETPAILVARIEDEDLTGKVDVRVYNPARGKQDGLSEAAPIEIVDEVVPPLGIKVGEAGREELGILRALRDERLKQGREFREYDPDTRYVTIRAIGLDYNAHYIRVKFEQGGQQFVLKYEDFSLSIDERLVVRVPDAIKPGSVQLTIQNKGASGLSDPVIATVEITQPSKK